MNRSEFLQSLPSRVALACDFSNQADLHRALDGLEGAVACVKIGRQAMVALDVGPAINTPLNRGFNVFIDGKEKDIKNTVAATAEAMLSKIEHVSTRTCGKVLFMNMHVAFVAAQAIQAFAEVVTGVGAVPLGVAVLTDIGENELREDLDFGYGGPNLIDVMLRFTEKALKNGIQGMVASAREAFELRKRFGNDFVIVTAAIRPGWSKKDDQDRVTTPTEAIQAGSDILVIGRPLTSHAYNHVAPTPIARLELVNQEVRLALAA